MTGPNSGRSEPYDPAAGAKRHGLDVLTFHHRLLFGTDPPAEMRSRLSGLEPSKLVTALLSSPEAQLG